MSEQPGSNLFGIQAWVALPSRHEEVAADFAHYSAPEVPRICARGVEFTLIAGTSDGLISPVKTFSDMVFAAIVLTSGARYQVKPVHRERAIYVIAGEVEIVGQPARSERGELILLEPGAEIVLKAPAFHAARLMLMGGEPLSEPRHMYWNFVSSSVRAHRAGKDRLARTPLPAVPGEDEFIPLAGGLTSDTNSSREHKRRTQRGASGGKAHSGVTRAVLDRTISDIG